MKRAPKVLEFEIVKINKKGNGIGFYTNQKGVETPIEVSFTLPQEIVKAEVVRRKKRDIGLLQEIIKPSSLRQEPKCRHFADCGGCRFQHISYSEELKIKEENVLSLFKPLLTTSADIRPIISCKEEWQYRNKMEFSFSTDLKGTKYLGLIRDSSKGRVVSLEECHLVSPWFMKALHSVRAWWEGTQIEAFHGMKGNGSLRALTLREGVRTKDKMAILTVSGNPEYALNKTDLEKFVKALNETFEDSDGSSLKSIFLRIQQTAKGVETNFYELNLSGTDHIRETLNVRLQNDGRPQQFSFHISPTAFFQPNTTQAERVYEEAIRIAEISKDDILYDLYCGTGTFSVIAAIKAKQVIGVEISPESILDAKTNADINGIENILFFTGAVHNVLEETQQTKTLPHPNIVVVDPPRAGLDPETMRCLIAISPPKILYISCNPETQSENIKVFQDNGYQIVSMQPIDQFPHTPHVENIVLLKKVPH